MPASGGQSAAASLERHFRFNHQMPATLLEQYDYTYTGLNLGYCRVETNAAAGRDIEFLEEPWEEGRFVSRNLVVAEAVAVAGSWRRLSLI